jgi:hypothetical protein
MYKFLNSVYTQRMRQEYGFFPRYLLYFDMTQTPAGVRPAHLQLWSLHMLDYDLKVRVQTALKVILPGVCRQNVIVT